MIFISDIHHGLDSLNTLPKDKGPLVILGDLINWIDYRNGEGIAKDVFGEENVMLIFAVCFDCLPTKEAAVKLDGASHVSRCEIGPTKCSCGLRH